MKTYKRYTITLLILILSGLLLCGLIVFIVDPYFQYHRPLSNFPYKINDQLTQNPGMAKHLSYDAVILGSSVTVNFDTTWFNEDFNVNAIKLPYNGAYPKDYSNIISQVEASGNELKYVFWTMDVASFSGDINETKYPIKKNLYDANPFNDISYLLNEDVLFEYIIFPFLSNPKNISDNNSNVTSSDNLKYSNNANLNNTLTNAYSSYQDLTYSREACLNNFASTNPDIDMEKIIAIVDAKDDIDDVDNDVVIDVKNTNSVNAANAVNTVNDANSFNGGILLPDNILPRDTFLQNAKINLETNIIPFIANHPDTQFIISFPPYSILSWLYYVNDGSIYALREEYNYVISELSKYDNVTIYYFCNEKNIIYNLDLYADSIHYNRDINYFMEQEFTKSDSKYIIKSNRR